MKGNDRFSPHGLHYFMVRATPKRRVGKLTKVQGAYVSCWINFRLHEGALHLARFYVREHGWSIKAVLKHTWLDGPKDVAPKQMRYFKEAKKDGASFVFHMYPRKT